jgi:hypothetical protein
MAQVKCQHCGNKDTDKQDMHVIEKVSNKGIVTRKYVHLGDCLVSYEAYMGFKIKEQAEKDSLNEKIKECHNIQIVPNTFFGTCLTPTREGNFRLNKHIVKKKEGYPFSVIEKAYDLSKDAIMYSKKNVVFDSINEELKYCFAIVIGKLPLAYKKLNQDKRQDEVAKELSAIQTTSSYDGNEVNYKKKEVKDYSDFLD